ncbi:MAG: carboxypeptidase regulatory-like domain-containing protein [Planctomycetes bacterium]|nr:carboxypeptidase regulatory-like domain-containing protein [Planctomycetota bacterium]
MRTAPWLAALLAATAAAQEPTCRLEGQVVDALQQAVGNAEVTASVDGEVVARTHSDGSGLFVFGRLPYRVVVVQARAAGPDIGVGWLDLLGLRRQFVRVVTQPARAVSGVVRDENGAPIAGAWVTSAPRGEDVTALAGSIVRADPDGAFQLSHVPFGRNTLRAWAPGYEAFDDVIAGDSDCAVECRLTTGTRQERVFRLDGATAVQRSAAVLEVTAAHRGFVVPLPPPLRRPVGSDGTWRLAGWPVADAVQVRVRLDDADVTPAVHQVPADVSGGVRRFAIDRDARARLRGTLTGTAARAGLWLCATPLLPSDGPVRVLGRTGDGGAFDLPAPTAAETAFALRVLDPDVAIVRQAPNAARCWWQASFVPGHHYEVPVASARHLHLRAVRADGTAVPGAAMQVFLASATEPGRSPVALDRSVQPLLCGTTGSDGTLELDGLDLDPDQELRCFLDAPAGWATVHCTPSTAAHIDLGAVTLTPGATLRVTAKDRAARPFAAARVDVECHWTLGPATWILRGNRAGCAVLSGLRPQDYRLCGSAGTPVGVAIEGDETVDVEVFCPGGR